ncbi:MAG: hypothetical protein WCF33_17820 [Pseudonocardiaceae bacterium]
MIAVCVRRTTKIVAERTQTAIMVSAVRPARRRHDLLDTVGTSAAMTVAIRWKYSNER